jgi:hypothetical protein
LDQGLDENALIFGRPRSRDLRLIIFDIIGHSYVRAR